MPNSQYGRPPSWQFQYGEPQLNTPQHPQRPLSHPNSPNFHPQQPYQHGYAPPTHYGAPPQTYQHYQPPPGYGYPPPAQGGYSNYPPPAQPHHPVLFLKRENRGATLTLSLDGHPEPLYRCVDTDRSSLSSEPDFVITRAGSDAAVGSIRYHQWLSESLDYWEVRGRTVDGDAERGGDVNLWAWRLEHADAARAQWRCYRRADLAGGRDPTDCPATAKLTFDWAANKAAKKSKTGVVVGRCDLFDASLLRQEERARERLDEFYVTAVVTIEGAMRAVAEAKEKHGGEVKDWAKLARKLEHIAEGGGYDGGGGGDGNDGGGDGGGGDGGGGGG
ncbi:hypothetical protein AAE478_000997 [Parahypoxylon ruwenzoriense]